MRTAAWRSCRVACGACRLRLTGLSTGASVCRDRWPSSRMLSSWTGAAPLEGTLPSRLTWVAARQAVAGTTPSRPSGGSRARRHPAGSPHPPLSSVADRRRRSASGDSSGCDGGWASPSCHALPSLLPCRGWSLSRRPTSTTRPPSVTRARRCWRRCSASASVVPSAAYSRAPLVGWTWSWWASSCGRPYRLPRRWRRRGSGGGGAGPPTQTRTRTRTAVV